MKIGLRGHLGGLALNIWVEMATAPSIELSPKPNLRIRTPKEESDAERALHNYVRRVVARMRDSLRRTFVSLTVFSFVVNIGLLAAMTKTNDFIIACFFVVSLFFTLYMAQMAYTPPVATVEEWLESM